MARARWISGALLAALVGTAQLSAQGPTGTIRGRVIDGSTQQAISGASVMVANRGALSGTNGAYVIPGVPAGAQTVRATYLGYAEAAKPVTVVAGQTANLDFLLETQAIGLNALVVVGYGQQKAGNITGAVKQVTATEFNTGRVVSPQQLIESKVAGVQVVDNNAPGGGLSIRIRGATSVNASSEPLYVVDGIPLGNGAGGGLSAGRDPLNFLNPGDIESITVLKDASAAAIYGANAANGVVLIQTKAGRNAPHVTYSTSMSSSSVTRVPQVLSPAQFRAAVAQYAPARVSLLGSASTDWFSQIDRSAFGQEHNFAVSGAGEHNNYRLSLGYLNQDGVIKGSANNRLSLGVNLEQRLLSDNLDLRVNAVGSRANDQFTAGDVLGNAVSMAPTQPVFDPTNVTGYWDWSTSGASASNPVASLNMSTDKGSTWRSIGNLQTEYALPFLQALKAHVNLGYDATKTSRESFTPSNLASQTRQTHGQLSISNNTQANTLFDAYLNYAGALNVVPGNIDLTGGYSYSQSHSEYPYFSETGIASNLLGVSGVPSATNVNLGQSVVDSKLISFFGRANYNLNDRYLLAFSLRRDGSSRFGPSNAWGYFPAASVAWRISQEPFLKNIEALSDLKVRASWGKTGNQAFADYQQYPTYTYGNAQAQYQFGDQFVTTIRPSAVDPNIKWEQTSSYDVGLDYGFLKQRVSGAIDWYTKKTSDLIFTVPVAAGTNFSNFLTTNIGSMQNKGLELSLSARVLESGAHRLGWTADFNASHNANQLLTITTAGSQVIRVGGVAGGVGTTIQVLEPGQPVNSFYVCRQAYNNGTPIEGKYLDSLGVNTVSSCDSHNLRAYHNPAPTWMLGHTSSFTYGHVDLGFTLRAYLGNYVYNNVASNGSYNALTNGGSPSNISSSVLKTGFVVPQYLSDYYVEKGSFLRMDNATVGYSFRYRDQPIRLYATVQNAFTSTSYTGVDPTAGLNGIDNNIYPRSRTVSGGLSVQF